MAEVAVAKYALTVLRAHAFPASSAAPVNRQASHAEQHAVLIGLKCFDGDADCSRK